MIEALKRNIFFSASGLVILVILMGGILKGFGLAHVVGIVALFILHNRVEIVALFEKAAPTLPMELNVLKLQAKQFETDIANLKTLHEISSEQLRNEISKANMAIAFKLGKPAAGQPQP